MLIKYIQIDNWRSFYGENNFLVSVDPVKNVTLIRAENGVGKTSLLAAINWCFFAILPTDSEFEDPTSLVNKYAVEHDGSHTTKVSIDFIHENKEYRAFRSYDQRTQKTQPLKLIELMDGGEVPSSKDNPDRFINSVIPKEMAPHFFFYGEATSRYTGTTGARKFGEAVKGILGSTVARMALDDLKKAMADYNRQASDSSSSEAQDAESAIENAEAKIGSYRLELDKSETEINSADDRIDRLNQELAGAKPAKEAQARRVRLETSFAQKESEKAKAGQLARSWVHRYATSVLAEELVVECGTVLREEDTRGKLPAPYDEKFVAEILEDEMCVCGRPIEKDSVEFEKIKALLDTAGDQVVMTRVMDTTNALGRLEQKAANAWVEFERNNDDLRRVERELLRLDADIQEISKELANNPLTDIQDKEAARTRAQQQKRQAEDRKADIVVNIKQLEATKAKSATLRDELIKKSDAAKRFVKRVQLAAALTVRLESRLHAEEELARSAIEDQIDKIVQKFMRKAANIKLDKQYQLRLYDETGSEVAKSTGENQLLGLAFTGAIANYAKERESRADDILLPGTVAPLVVDSPFGHLDPTYRKGVAEFLPDLASQVILLVSTSQASEVVMATLEAKIGHEYVLARHNRVDGAGKQKETITIRDHTYDLTHYGSEFDGAKIVEVR
jgi:DNA sulfur modification protein DndD